MLQNQHQQKQAAMVVTGAVCLPAGLVDLTTLPQLSRESPMSIDAVMLHLEELFMSALMEGGGLFLLLVLLLLLLLVLVLVLPKMLVVHIWWTQDSGWRRRIICNSHWIFGRTTSF
jgi:hypothetical protein